MDLETTTGTLGHIWRHWEEQRRASLEGAAVGPGLTIALAREAGTPGTTVAHEVGRLLGWQVYDYELLKRISQETGLRTGLLESVDERKGGWLKESFGAFLAVPSVSADTYVRHLVEIILALGSHGQCIIVGRGAAHVLPPATTLRVRLMAPLEDRIAATAKRLGLGQREAVREVERVERERADFVREFFRRDLADPRNYDLILNHSRFGTAGCAAVIVATIGQVPIKPTEQK
jgi:cytidylate kinase